MDLINYIVSILLVLISVLVWFKPQLIAGYNSLPQEKKDKFPKNKLVLGFCFTAFINPIIPYNIRFGGYNRTADWFFLFTVTLGIIITIWAVNRDLNKD